MASKFMLCSFKTCPWVQRAAIVLRAKQVPYDITYIDRDNRPDWFLAISRIQKCRCSRSTARKRCSNPTQSLNTWKKPRHRSCTLRIRLHARAIVHGPTTCRPSQAFISTTAYSDSEDEFISRAAKIAGPFAKLEAELVKRGNADPFFNGRNLSLVDAAYAPFLQRYSFMDRVRPLGVIEKFPHLAGSVWLRCGALGIGGAAVVRQLLWTVRQRDSRGRVCVAAGLAYWRSMNARS
jgi:glutathione S-transferase